MELIKDFLLSEVGDAQFFLYSGNSPEPRKLIVGGLHGSEGKTTVKLLRKFISVKAEGTVVMINFTQRVKYVSTLNKKFYGTKVGAKLIRVIAVFKPSVYVELHSYSTKNYNKLVDPGIRWRKGVPPLVELEKGFLLGSVSPPLRFSMFNLDDFCAALEIPRKTNDMKVGEWIVEQALKSRDREEAFQRISERYPEQMHKLNKYFIELSKETPYFSGEMNRG